MQLEQEEGYDAQMFSHFKLQRGIIIMLISCLIFLRKKKKKNKIKSAGFHVKLTQIWILASASSCETLSKLCEFPARKSLNCKIKVIILLHRHVGRSKQVISKMFMPCLP